MAQGQFNAVSQLWGRNAETHGLRLRTFPVLATQSSGRDLLGPDNMRPLPDSFILPVSSDAS